MELKFPQLVRDLNNFHYKDFWLTNFEMETSSLYGLSSLLGHEASTVCAIIANRYRKEFCEKPNEIISDLIDFPVGWTFADNRKS